MAQVLKSLSSIVRSGLGSQLLASAWCVLGACGHRGSEQVHGSPLPPFQIHFYKILNKYSLYKIATKQLSFQLYLFIELLFFFVCLFVVWVSASAFG